MLVCSRSVESVSVLVCPLTVNKDVLFEIYIRVDAQTMSKLLFPELWDWIREFLYYPRFWYQRIHVSHPITPRWCQETDWRKLHNALLTSSHDIDVHTKLLDHLPTLKTSVDMQSMAYLRSESFETRDRAHLSIWSRVASKDVLLYLLREQSLAIENRFVMHALEYAILHFLLEMVEFTLWMLGWEPRRAAAPGEASTGPISSADGVDVVVAFTKQESLPWLCNIFPVAVSRSKLEVVQLMLEQVGRDVVTQRAYQGAIQPHCDVRILQALIDSGTPPHNVTELLKTAIKAKNVPAVTALMTLDVKDIIPWRQLLDAAIKTKSVELVRFFLIRGNRPTKANQTLKIAVRKGSEMVRLVLSTSTLNPMSNIEEVLAETSQILRSRSKSLARTLDVKYKLPIAKSEDQDYETLFLILGDKRVKTEALSPLAIRVASWILSPIVLLDEDDDICSQIQRHIILKRPSPASLVDWMTARGNVQIVRAARATLDLTWRGGSDAELERIRALMFSILYPYRSLDRIALDVGMGPLILDLAHAARDHTHGSSHGSSRETT